LNKAQTMKILREADLATVSGAILALGGLFLGFRLEGIQLYDMSQLTAALVVFCGTAGAVLISMPWRQTEQALKVLPSMFRSSSERDSDVIDRVIEYARAARQGGLLSLEQKVESIEDLFFRKTMRLVVDAIGSEVMESVLDSDLAGFKMQSESAAVFYETAAGYAPTLGMAGAAIGLIQVMKHLEHIDQVGMGVAAAFVATIYGVLLANLILLPIATKIRARAEHRTHICGLIREGALSIAAGLNPSVIRLKLEALAQIGEQDPIRPATAARRKTLSVMAQ
jgi:chemotaxis protein MotA